ncbi:MAG: histidine decarboxylase, pyruvoyl type [Nitrospinae bacterium]|nr:histidine decarboxylase, pyruvoyl type [Nitrospinota bacterium]
MDLKDVVNGAVGPFDDYCDGYGNPGASGNGYISVITLSTGVVEQNHAIDKGLTDIIAFDRAEAGYQTKAGGSYIGQINMIQASSFCGLNGAIWGYHLADNFSQKNETPYCEVVGAYGKKIPVYDMQPLIDAGQALFGTRDDKKFPLLPGASVLCAEKSHSVSVPNISIKPRLKGKVGFVWCALGLAIAKNRNETANLFMEDTGELDIGLSEGEAIRITGSIPYGMAESIATISRNQKIEYEMIFTAHRWIPVPPGSVGCALVACPYSVLAKNAVPKGEDAASIIDMTLDEWKSKVYKE